MTPSTGTAASLACGALLLAACSSPLPPATSTSSTPLAETASAPSAPPPPPVPAPAFAAPAPFGASVTGSSISGRAPGLHNYAPQAMKIIVQPPLPQRADTFPDKDPNKAVLVAEQPVADVSYADIARLANDARGDDRDGYRAEFVKLVRMAESLDKVGAGMGGQP